jgi:hypothetical protein
MILSMNLDIGMGLEVLSDLTSPLCGKLEQFFEHKNYGDGILRVAIILNCRPGYLNFKLRKRYDKATKTLYYDVMLNYELVKEMSDLEKKKTIHEALLDSVDLVTGYQKKIKEFDFMEYKKNWKNFFWEFQW